MRRKVVKIKKMPEKEQLIDLLELLLYHNLSYPTGQKDSCTIALNDTTNEIYTPEIIYKLSDEVYVNLYLLSNKLLATIYREIYDDQKL